MRIWYLANAASIHTRKWVTFFANKGHDVSLFSYTIPQDAMPNVDMHPLGTSARRVKVLSYLHKGKDLLRLRACVKRSKPDLVHAHFVTGYGFLGALLGFHPFVVTAWGSDILIGPKESTFQRWIARYVLKEADLMTCDGDHISREMTRLGADSRKIKVVPFGVDTQKFNPNKKDEDFKKNLHFEQESLTIVSLRNLSRLYDVETLIRAGPIVLRNVPQAKFIIVGDGNQEQHLRNLAQSLAIADSVRFVGVVSNDELPRYLASADAYVSTSLSDSGIATSTAEAMASQLPVVITDVADNRNWVKDGKGGFIVPPGNPAALAERIIYLLQNQAARRSFGAANRRVIQERNEYRDQMQIVERLYEELVEKC